MGAGVPGSVRLGGRGGFGVRWLLGPGFGAVRVCRCGAGAVALSATW